MRRLGVVARADSGGLGNLTWELCRALQPDRVLIADIGEYGRSDTYVDRYDGLNVRVHHGLCPDADDRAWLLDGSDVIYSAETWYSDDLPIEAAKAGVRTVLHVMPELFKDQMADELWIPTIYRRQHVPGARLVPVPVALDRFTFEPRTPAEHFVALWAPAMLDRNGTDAVFASLEAIRVPLRVTVLGAQRRVELSDGPVTLDCEPRPYPKDYWGIWPDDADVLVIPRRYAGLSMPVQEAAARGMPAIMTAVEPQNEWPNIVGVSTRGRPARQRMAGGLVDVHDPDPIGIAQAIERLATSETYAGEMSYRARAWAETLSWDVWADRYRQLLGLID